MDDGRPLSDEEAALVFRRATELDVELAGRSEGWDVAQLEAVGREVGISDDAVRRAVAEVRLGPSPGALPGTVVRATRMVGTPPRRAQSELAAWLHDQLLEPVRDRPGVAVFDRRHDPDADRRRQRDHARRYRLGGVERVALAVVAIPGDRSAVRLEAAMPTSRMRRALVRTAAAAPAAWLGATVLAAGSGAVGMEHVWLVTPPIVAGCGWWAWRSAGRADAAAVDEVSLALEAALDRVDG